MIPGHQKFQPGTCEVCKLLRLVQRCQRGVTHIEWVKVCQECQSKIYKRNYRNARLPGQLDLFAK